MAEREGAVAACDWSDEEDASNINDAWKDAFDREVTRRPHRGVARDCLVPRAVTMLSFRRRLLRTTSARGTSGACVSLRVQTACTLRRRREWHPVWVCPRCVGPES